MHRVYGLILRMDVIVAESQIRPIGMERLQDVWADQRATFDDVIEFEAARIAAMEINQKISKKKKLEKDKLRARAKTLAKNKENRAKAHVKKKRDNAFVWPV